MTEETDTDPMAPIMAGLALIEWNVHFVVGEIEKGAIASPTVRDDIRSVFTDFAANIWDLWSELRGLEEELGDAPDRARCDLLITARFIVDTLQQRTQAVHALVMRLDGQADTPDGTQAYIFVAETAVNILEAGIKVGRACGSLRTSYRSECLASAPLYARLTMKRLARRNSSMSPSFSISSLHALYFRNRAALTGANALIRIDRKNYFGRNAGYVSGVSDVEL